MDATGEATKATEVKEDEASREVNPDLAGNYGPMYTVITVKLLPSNQGQTLQTPNEYKHTCICRHSSKYSAHLGMYL